MEIHGAGRAPIAELVADAQILELAADTGVRCHIVHSTIAAGNRIARHYRERGAKISVETCVHYFVFNDQDAIRQGAFLKLNPPIRAEAERLEMWRSLAAGEIDLVSTDHVAWPLSRKSDPDMAKNGSGIPGLETLLPAFYTGAVQGHGHSPILVAQMAAENPAKHFGLYPRKGAIAVGADADIAVFSPEERVFEAEKMTSNVKWSPYNGMKMAGFTRATFVRGRKVFENGDVLVDAGYGQFVQAKLTYKICNEASLSSSIEKLTPALAALFDKIRDDSRDGEGVTRDAFGPRETQAAITVEAFANARGSKPATTTAATCTSCRPDKVPHRRKS